MLRNAAHERSKFNLERRSLRERNKMDLRLPETFLKEALNVKFPLNVFIVNLML